MRAEDRDALQARTAKGGASSTPEALLAVEVPVTPREMIEVADEESVRGMVADLLSAERVDPVVGVSNSPETAHVVLSHEQVRSAVGEGVRIYHVAGDFALNSLESALGHRLCLRPGTVRAWWPGLSLRSDGGDHPMVSELESEDSEQLLGEFAVQFDLTRPRVRAAIRLIEELRAHAERQYTEANQRAQRAEKRATVAESERDRALRQAGRVDASQSGQQWPG